MHCAEPIVDDSGQLRGALAFGYGTRVEVSNKYVVLNRVRYFFRKAAVPARHVLRFSFMSDLSSPPRPDRQDTVQYCIQDVDKKL